MPAIHKILPCLWFNGQGEEAAKFYTGIFPNSRITQTTYYGEAGKEQHGQKPGSVLTVAFELDGHQFTALNGGPDFKFTEAISFQVMCDTQDEVDHYWEKLGAGGPSEAQICGWLKDKFGVSWQIVPKVMIEMLTSSDQEKSQRAMGAMMQMSKLDIATLEKAFRGEEA